MYLLIIILIGLIMSIFSLCIMLSKNPIYTVLLFILIIFCISIYLIGFLQNELLGLVLLIVYAGAIAVLFLFVVMMLNIRLIELAQFSWGYLPFGILFSSLFICELLAFFFSKISLTNFFYSYSFSEKIGYFLFYNNFVDQYYSLETVYNISYLFYNYYYFQVVMISILLLIAMIGAIILTLPNKISNILKQQDVFNQIEKTITNGIRKHK